MQAIEGNTVEIYLQTEWKRSYTGYTQPVNGRFILNATQVAINVCICLMCVCMSSLVCIHACAISRRFAFLRVFVFALKHPALTFANTHTRTRKQAVVGDVVRISGRVPPRLFFGKWREHVQYSMRASCTNSGPSANSHGWEVTYTLRLHMYKQVSARYNDLVAASGERCSVVGDGLGTCARARGYAHVHTCMCAYHA